MATLKNIELDDDEDPAFVTLRLSLHEVAAIYFLVGYVSPRSVTEATNIDIGNALVDVGDCLSGAFFNRFYEAGADDVLGPRRHKIVVEPR